MPLMGMKVAVVGVVVIVVVKKFVGPTAAFDDDAKLELFVLLLLLLFMTIKPLFVADEAVITELVLVDDAEGAVKSYEGGGGAFAD